MRRRFILACIALFAGIGPALAATPPTRPKAGLPGGLENPTGEVARKAVGRASAVTYAFHLEGAPAGPRPVAVFLHAWGAVNPLNYGGWIDHLARRGYLVLFPAFHRLGQTRPVDASANATTLLRDALAELANDPQARPDTTRIALIGHSAGAGIAANLAAGAKEAGLPAPKLVFMLMPGGLASDPKARGVQLADLSRIEPATALVTMIGDRAFQASDRAARRLLREATDVPPNHKLFMRVLSDDHGFPTLSATLAAPASPKEGYEMATIKVAPDPPVDRRAPRPQQPRWSADMVLSGEQQVLIGEIGRNPTDSLDYLAFWKTFDMLAAGAFAGTVDLVAMRNYPAFLDMSRWSDSWPVKRLYAETPKPVDATAAAAKPAAASIRQDPAPTKMPVTRQRNRSRDR